VIPYYEAQELVVRVDGEQAPEAVYKQIDGAIG
jgi:adenylate kinase family enzyme